MSGFQQRKAGCNVWNLGAKMSRWFTVWNGRYRATDKSTVNVQEEEAKRSLRLPLLDALNCRTTDAQR